MWCHWLAATPDRKVYAPDRNPLLEIKCPDKNNFSDVKCLHIQDGELKLKKKTIIIIKFRCKLQFQDLVGVIFLFGWKMSLI
jgi:hypothetical protein